MLCAAWRHRIQSPDLRAGCPALPSFPGVSPWVVPVFGGERFLLPIGRAAQGLSARSSRFFFHPHDICRLSPMHTSFPPGRPQPCPQAFVDKAPPTSRPGSGLTTSPCREVSEAGCPRLIHRVREEGISCRQIPSSHAPLGWHPRSPPESVIGPGSGRSLPRQAWRAWSRLAESPPVCPGPRTRHPQVSGQRARIPGRALPRRHARTAARQAARRATACKAPRPRRVVQDPARSLPAGLERAEKGRALQASQPVDLPWQRPPNRSG